MLNYSPTSEVNSERVLLVNLEPKTQGLNCQRITARVLRRAVSKTVNDDGTTHEYNDGLNAKNFRNTTWSSNKKSALFVEDFVIYSQFDLGSSDSVYGMSVKFADMYSVDLSQAEQVVRTLKTVEKSLDKIEQKYGRIASDDFASYLARVASVFGIDKFVFYTEKNALKRDYSYDQNSYDEYDAPSLAYKINQLVKYARNGD
jgi:hypothetical protein